MRKESSYSLSIQLKYKSIILPTWQEELFFSRSSLQIHGTIYIGSNTSSSSLRQNEKALFVFRRRLQMPQKKSLMIASNLLSGHCKPVYYGFGKEYLSYTLLPQEDETNALGLCSMANRCAHLPRVQQRNVETVAILQFFCSFDWYEKCTYRCETNRGLQLGEITTQRYPDATCGSRQIKAVINVASYCSCGNLFFMIFHQDLDDSFTPDSTLSTTIIICHLLLAEQVKVEGWLKIRWGFTQVGMLVGLSVKKPVRFVLFYYGQFGFVSEKSESYFDWLNSSSCFILKWTRATRSF